MVDATLETEIVLDETALENIEQKQLEISGEPGSISDAEEQNEEQTGLLAVAARQLGRLKSLIKSKFGLIVAAVLGLTALVASAFDIGLSDVREGIVRLIGGLVDSVIGAVDSLENSLLGVLGIGGQGAVQSPEQNRVSGSEALSFGAGLLNPLPGSSQTALSELLRSNADFQNSQNAGQQNTSEQDTQPGLLFPQNKLFSNSSTQERVTQNNQDFLFEGGS